MASPPAGYNSEAEVASAEESSPDSDSMEESSEDEGQDWKIRGKKRFTTPVTACGEKMSAFKSVPPGKVYSKPRLLCVSKSLPREFSTPSAKQGPSTGRKVLNMSSTENPASNISSVLGEISNMLGKVIERLDKTEYKIESMERTLKSEYLSSGTSGPSVVGKFQELSG